MIAQFKITHGGGPRFASFRLPHPDIYHNFPAQICIGTYFSTRRHDPMNESFKKQKCALQFFYCTFLKKKDKNMVYNWGQRNGFDKGENVTDEEGLDSNCYGTTAASTY